MRRLASSVFATLFFISALLSSVSAAEKSTQSESPKEEQQVAKPTLEDKGNSDDQSDIEDSSWSNVKALWG